MKKVIIIGAGGHGQVIADILKNPERPEHKEERLFGFVDDNSLRHGTLILGHKVFGTISEIVKINPDSIIIAIGNNQIRKNIAEKCSPLNYSFTTAIDPKTIIAEDVVIGKGSMICGGAIIKTGTKISQHAILNSGCIIGHHNSIGDYVHIGPGAQIAGEVIIEDGALIGIGAIVLPRCRIGAGSIVGAGAVVTKSVPDHCTVVGIPAKVISHHFK